MESASTPLKAGLRILVVEDEPLIGLMLTSMLEDLDCIVLGPVSRLAEALAGATEMQLDAAILDLNLNGISSLAVADILRGRGIPVILSTGYGDLPAGVASSALRKPYDAAAVGVALHAALKGAA